MTGLSASTLSNPHTTKVIMECYLKERTEDLCEEKTDKGRKCS